MLIIPFRTCTRRFDREGISGYVVIPISSPNCDMQSPDLRESIGNGLFPRLPILNSLELRLAIQTFNDSTYLYQQHLQEGNEQLAIRFYRRTLEVNLFVLDYFQNADLQNQARIRIPSLYYVITLVDLETIVIERILFLRTRSEQPIRPA